LRCRLLAEAHLQPSVVKRWSLWDHVCIAPFHFPWTLLCSLYVTSLLFLPCGRVLSKLETEQTGWGLEQKNFSYILVLMLRCMIWDLSIIVHLFLWFFFFIAAIMFSYSAHFYDFTFLWLNFDLNHVLAENYLLMISLGHMLMCLLVMGVLFLWFLSSNFHHGLYLGPSLVFVFMELYFVTNSSCTLSFKTYVVGFLLW